MAENKLAPRGKRGFSEKKSSVCSHIHNSVSIGRDIITVYPFSFQIFEDGYNLTWYCDKCKELYSLPNKGVYIFDSGDDFSTLSKNLNSFRVSSDISCNPYMDFIESECKYSVDESKFKSSSRGFMDDPVSNNNEILRIPFGLERAGDSPAY